MFIALFTLLVSASQLIISKDQTDVEWSYQMQLTDETHLAPYFVVKADLASLTSNLRMLKFAVVLTSTKDMKNFGLYQVYMEEPIFLKADPVIQRLVYRYDLLYHVEKLRKILGRWPYISFVVGYFDKHKIRVITQSQRYDWQQFRTFSPVSVKATPYTLQTRGDEECTICCEGFDKKYRKVQVHSLRTRFLSMFCGEPFGDQDPYKPRFCNHLTHCKCMKGWVKSCNDGEITPNCPSCRSIIE